jgi:hypothetical protein
MMKKSLIAGILVVLGLTWLVGSLVRPRQSQADGARLGVNLGGPPGLVVTGTFTLDGVTNAFAGTTPTNLPFVARELSYALQTTSQGAGLRVTLYVDDLPRTSVLAGTNGGIRGHYRLQTEAQNGAAAGF